MKKNYALICAFLFLLGGHNGMQAQYRIVTGGGNIAGAAGKIGYTIGDLIADATGENGTLMSGIQLPSEIFWLGISENGLPPRIRIFPNPVTDDIFLESEDISAVSMFYQLYSAEGQLLCSGSTCSRQTGIHVGQFPPGLFLLRLYTEKQAFGTVKIIKTR